MRYTYIHTQCFVFRTTIMRQKSQNPPHKNVACVFGIYFIMSSQLLLDINKKNEIYILKYNVKKQKTKTPAFLLFSVIVIKCPVHAQNVLYPHLYRYC